MKGTYLVNLGPIVAGSKASKQIGIRNIGSTHLSYLIDQRLLKTLGLSLTFPKVSKLSPGTSNMINMTMVYSTKRSMKSGPVCFDVPIVVDSGPKYILEVSADIIGKTDCF